LVREYSGTVTGDEVFDSIMELTSQDRFADVSYIINDYTNMTDGIVALHRGYKF